MALELLKRRGGELVLIAAACLSGCSLIYQNEHQEGHFVLYSDLSPEFLSRAAGSIKQIFRGYSRLFEMPPDRLGTVTFIFNGSSAEPQVVDYSYSPNLLGYYMPFFHLIAVDTTPAWAREPELLRQILLHELAHHFVIQQFPPANQECWLNEGLAGNLETALFDGDHFEYPLLNPSLLQIASGCVGAGTSDPPLARLIDMDWSEFHESQSKEKHYALAWSIVYFILEEHLPADWPLGRRIQSLYQFDRQALKQMEPRWISFLMNYNLTEKLVQLATLEASGEERHPSRLMPAWAIQQLGSLKSLDQQRALSILVRLFDDPRPWKRQLSYLSFIRLLSSSYYMAPGLETLEAAVKGRLRIEQALLEAAIPPDLRLAMVLEASRALVRQPHWVPVFISLLEAPDGEIRAAAAQGLAQAEIKPTIVNPAFWKEARHQAERQSEINEWKDWWVHHRSWITRRDRAAR
ncbi:MAG: hypothetical protein HY717_00985 [Planctomycetes bacterium]|nr:hypothetical protein [Planctomycetota bacterium]